MAHRKFQDLAAETMSAESRARAQQVADEMPCEMPTGVGVVIGRFQVPSLAPSHLALLEKVDVSHAKLVVLIGVTPARGTKRNPLDYQTRAQIVLAEFPYALVMPILDQPTDEQWSASVDALLRPLFGNETITLYGGRDSFLPHYKGKLATSQFDEIIAPCGSEIRRQIASEPIDSEHFRAGVIYGIENTYTRAYQTVDVVIYDDHKNFLLARKPNDPPGQWRFVGGFVDPSDESLELAAKREVFEETGLDVGRPAYIGSARIDDWRFRGGPESVMTAVFAAKRLFGAAKAADDISELQWFKSYELPSVIAPLHRPILNLILANELLGVMNENTSLRF